MLLTRIEFRRQPVPCHINCQSITQREGKVLLGFGTNKPQMEEAQRIIDKYQVPYKVYETQGLLSIAVDMSIISNLTTISCK